MHTCSNELTLDFKEWLHIYEHPMCLELVTPCDLRVTNHGQSYTLRTVHHKKTIDELVVFSRTKTE